MIKNIIFDFGGVVVTISHDEALRRFTQLGLPDAEKWLKQKTKRRDRRQRGGKSRLWDILTTDRYTWVIYAVMWAIAALVALWFKFKK